MHRGHHHRARGRRRRRRRRVLRPLHAPPAPRPRAHARRCSRPPPTSAAPGGGTATRAPAATSSRWTTRTRSTPSSSRSGPGASATPPSPRSCLRRTTSPTGSTCAATSGFETRVTRAEWDHDAQRWSVETDRGDRLSAHFLVMAVGCLSAAKRPEIDGIDTFAGPEYHTGEWPHEGVDFSGLRVGVIGTGSSGIQSIPLIAEQAAHLTVFQRTPNYAMPAKNAPARPGVRRRPQGELPRATARCCAGRPTAAWWCPRPPTPPSPSTPRSGERHFTERWESGTLFGLLVVVQRPHDRPRRQRHRGRVRARPHPRDRRRPRGGREARAHELPVRHQAGLPRHRLLRDLQPRQRHPRRPAGHPDRGDRARGRAHHRPACTSSTPSCSPPASTP